tara:strand:- start:2234 stop:3241 length:1008 start_codon:yes stop_codon:yes gene_type:complete
MKWTSQQLYNKISSSIQAGENVAISGNGSTLTISSTAAGGGGGGGNAFATASVSGEDNILANSSSGSITFAAGSGISLATNASTDTLTITATGGGGGTTFKQWDAMAPPSTANALDDEFSGSLSGWSTWNAGSVTFSATTDTTREMLVIECDTVPGDRLVGIYKAAPTASSGDYTYAFWSKVSWVSLDDTNFPNVGIFIAEDIAGSPTSAKAWNCVIAREQGIFQIRAQIWNSYTSYGGASVNNIYRSFSYLRIRVSYASSGNTTTYNFEHSADGVGWFQLVQRTYTGHLPYIGFLINNVQGSDKIQGWCDFFRVYDDYEFYYPPSGSLVERTLA